MCEVHDPMGCLQVNAGIRAASLRKATNYTQKGFGGGTGAVFTCHEKEIQHTHRQQDNGTIDTCGDTPGKSQVGDMFAALTLLETSSLRSWV